MSLKHLSLDFLLINTCTEFFTRPKQQMSRVLFQDAINLSSKIKVALPQFLLSLMRLLLLFHQIISLALTQILQAHLCHPGDRPKIRVLRVADLKMALSDVLGVKDRLRLCRHLADALCPGSLLQGLIF